jgi:REP element-mobilizing transposase RayT
MTGFDRPRHDAVTSRMRLRGYDYATPGEYFVTICAAQRACLFGAIKDHQVELSPAGVMIESWWHSIPRRFPCVVLDAMIVMPNHVHGVVILTAQPESPDGAAPPTLSDVMHWFKTRTTIDYGLGVKTLGWTPYHRNLWQPKFHDHIVRSEHALDRICSYIEANPSQWPHDDENPNRSLQSKPGIVRPCSVVPCSVGPIVPDDHLHETSRR